jgi:hypothetical protein
MPCSFELHGFRSGEPWGHISLIITLSPETLCKHCIEFNWSHSTYHSINCIKMCVTCQYGFVVSKNSLSNSSVIF